MESRRGAEGGYLLARPPDAISVGEVLRYVEGRHDEKWRQRRETASPFSEIWERVDQAISDVIDSTTFAALIRQWADKRTQFVPNWDI